jgi:hypothetical protein
VKSISAGNRKYRRESGVMKVMKAASIEAKSRSENQQAKENGWQSSKSAINILQQNSKINMNRKKISAK